MKNYEIEILINKILNEFKYNKRYVYNWKKWFGVHKGYMDDNIRVFLKDKIKIVYQMIENNDFKYDEEDCDSIPLFKKIEVLENNTAEDKKNIISFSPESQIKGEIDYNCFMHSSIEVFILGAIWVLKVGAFIDSKLSDDVYANRISSKSYFFEPYFKSYSNFRDSVFNEVKKDISTNRTAVLVQTDLSRCFYSVNIEYLEQQVKQLIENQDELIVKINTIVFDIIKKYNQNKRLNEFIEKKVANLRDEKDMGALPIGFLPSNILINLYLEKLDTKVKTEMNPLIYARYVDDILFVLKKEINSRNVDKTVLEISNKLSSINTSINKSKGFELRLNNEKTLYFVIDKSSDLNYIRKFEKETAEFSSDNFRIIDPLEFEDEFNKAYLIQKDITKLSDFFTITKDKKHLSRIISTVFYTIYRTLREEKHPDNIKLCRKFIKSFYEFIDNEFFLELYDYWYQLFSIELIANESLKKVEDSQFYSRLKRMVDIIQIEMNKTDKSLSMFINNYLEVIKFISFSDSTLIADFRKNFKLPKFKYNYTGSEKYLLNYEKQLRDLYEITKNLHTEELQKSSGGNFLQSLEKLIAEWSDDGDISNKTKKTTDGTEIKIVDYEKKKKILLAQANLYEYDKRYDYFKEHLVNQSSFSEVNKVLNHSETKDADIISFPELAISIEDLAIIVNHAVKTRTLITGGLDFILIAGKVINLSLVVIPRKTLIKRTFETSFCEYQDAKIILIPKVYPSPDEYNVFHNSKPKKQGMNWEMYIPYRESSKKDHTFEYRGYKHAFLNCYEATSIDLKYEISQEEPVLIHLITNNKDINYYYHIAESLSRDLMAISSITNYAKLGGVQVFSPYKKEYLRILSSHKGSKNTHVDICEINIEDIEMKRVDNLNQNMKQNPPKYYYKNVGRI